MTGQTRRRPSAARLRILRRQGGDAGWTVFDQGLSAASNLVVSIAAGRAGGEQLLGAFTIGFTVYLLLLGFSRALFSEPLLSLPVEDDRTPDRAAVTCVAMYSVVAGGAVALVGAALGSTTLLAVAVVLPALLGQDLLRFAAFRRRRARSAAALDGIWLGALLLAWPVLTSTGSAAVLVLLWGAGAALAVLWGLRAVTPTGPRTAWRWWQRDARRVGGLLAVEGVVYSVTGQGVVFGLAALLGTAELGRLRAAQLLLGPATTMLVAFNAFVLPRLASRADRVSSRQALQLSAASAAASVVAVAASVGAAPAVERLFFGDRLDVSLRLVVVLGIAMVVLATSAGVVLHLKALRDLGPHTFVGGCAAMLSVPLVLSAAQRGGLDLAALAMLVQAAVVSGGAVVAWQYTLRRRARRAADLMPE